MAVVANSYCLGEVGSDVKTSAFPTTTRAWACDWARLLAPGAFRLARFYVKNRRDGSRLLSSALVICVAGLVRIDHPIGQAVALLAGLVSLYWWNCYRQLQQ